MRYFLVLHAPLAYPPEGFIVRLTDKGIYQECYFLGGPATDPLRVFWYEMQYGCTPTRELSVDDLFHLDPVLVGLTSEQLAFVVSGLI